MSLEENKALVRLFLDEVYNKKNFSALEDLCTDDYVWHEPGGIEYKIAKFKRLFTRFYTTFPNLHVTIEDMIAEGDKVVAYTTRKGIHKGAYRDIPATGKQVTWTWISVFHIEAGKIVEQWDEGDHLSVMQQMGAIITADQNQGTSMESRTTANIKITPEL